MIYCVRGSCPGPLDECGFFRRFPFEIECKDTTFFPIGKFFYKTFFFFIIKWIEISMLRFLYLSISITGMSHNKAGDGLFLLIFSVF